MNHTITNDDEFDCEEDCTSSTAIFSPSPMHQGNSEHQHTLDFDDKLTNIRFQLQPKGSDATTSQEISYKYNDILEETNGFLAETFATIASLLQLCNSSCTVDLPIYLRGADEVLRLLAPFLSEAAAVQQAGVSLSSLPSCGARILFIVFTHCRNSECLYGKNLGSVQSLLKELFSSCRALLLVYLDMMQNFALKSDENDSVAMIIDALYKNIEIGSVVVQLDVRTMADQWKGLVALCEKHSECLSGSGVPGRCVDTLVALVLDNLHSCVSDEHDPKSMQRSLKVTSFLMKIIIKMCQIFKREVTDDYSQLVTLLITMKSNSGMYLRILNKSETLIQQIQSHITVSAEPLLLELLDNTEFSHAVMRREVESENDVATLGRLLLLVSVCEAVLSRDEEVSRQVWLGDTPAGHVVCCILGLMPHCHVWLSSGARLDCRGGGACGLYETVLSGACALAATAAGGQHAALRRGALAALLRPDCWAATLAADLCVALARYSTAELCIQQISQLIAIYKRINRSSESPQRVYLSVTIRRLFNTLLDEDKLSVLAAYPCRENVVVWEAIGVRHLPEVQAVVESRAVFAELSTKLELCCGEECDENDFEELVMYMALATTCVPADVPCPALVRLWRRCGVAAARAAGGGGWLDECVRAASALTAACCRGPHFTDGQLAEILDIIVSIIAQSSSAFKLSVIKVLSALAYHKATDDNRTVALCTQITKLFQKLLTDNEQVVAARAIISFELFCRHSDHTGVILDVVTNASIKDFLIHFIKSGEIKTKSELSWMEQLRLTSKMKFTHKCKDFDANETTKDMEGDSTDHFEMPDIESLFDDSDVECEPASKKIKVKSHELDNVLCRLENDVTLLEKIKENVFTEDSVRIENIIDKLKNILC